MITFYFGTGYSGVGESIFDINESLKTASTDYKIKIKWYNCRRGSDSIDASIPADATIINFSTLIQVGNIYYIHLTQPMQLIITQLSFKKNR